ncbi:MAG: hypothetical protein LHW57_02855 [Candidatus Cloacimonetes bacterium]|jgi:hypothetical protein|nr:hypothetical protein [Candidatus Cloacimonadota bacterium]
MKYILLCVLALAVSGLLVADPLSCYDVQYTTAASGASPYSGSVVTVEGIVVAEVFYTGTSTTNKGFVISDPEGGPWSGLLIFTNQYAPQRGDLVQVTGTITEYYEFTEMSPTTGFQVLSQGNPLPPATQITTGSLTGPDAEQWESVFVKVENLTITATPNNYGEFYVTDGSGACQIDDQCFPRSGFSWPQMSVGQNWARIQGVVDYSFSYFGVNPREMTDLVQIDDVSNATVRVQTTNAEIDTPVEVNILTSRLKPEWGVASYSAYIRLDPDKVQFNSLDITETMTAFDPQYTLSVAGDSLYVVYQSQEPITSTSDDQVLFKLNVTPTSYGESVIELVSFSYDATAIQSLNNGKLLVPIRSSIAWLNITNPNNARNIFNPELNEKITIEYGCKTSAAGINVKAIVRIYDAQGRLVATPVNRNISNALGIESFQWDGRDYMMNRLPIGLYYCHLEVIERSTGLKEVTVQPVVIKSILK